MGLNATIIRLTICHLLLRFWDGNKQIVTLATNKGLTQTNPSSLEVGLFKPLSGCCLRLSNRDKKDSLLKNCHDKKSKWRIDVSEDFWVSKQLSPRGVLKHIWSLFLEELLTGCDKNAFVHSITGKELCLIWHFYWEFSLRKKIKNRIRVAWKPIVIF